MSRTRIPCRGGPRTLSQPAAAIYGRVAATPAERRKHKIGKRYLVANAKAKGYNCEMQTCCRLLLAIGSALALAFSVAIPGNADPSDAPGGSPFPELSRITTWYTQLQPDEFFISDNRPVVGDTTGDPICLVLVTLWTQLRHLVLGQLRLRR